MKPREKTADHPVPEPLLASVPHCTLAAGPQTLDAILVFHLMTPANTHFDFSARQIDQMTASARRMATVSHVDLLSRLLMAFLFVLFYESRNTTSYFPFDRQKNFVRHVNLSHRFLCRPPSSAADAPPTHTGS